MVLTLLVVAGLFTIGGTGRRVFAPVAAVAPADLRVGGRESIAVLGTEIAVLDRAGEVHLTNFAWSAQYQPNGGFIARLRGRDREGNPLDCVDQFKEFLHGSATTLRIEQPIWDAQRGRWYQIRAAAFGLGESRRVVLSREDVTAIQAAQQGLTASEARYRAIVENQEEIVVRLTPDLVLTFVNPAYCALRGGSEHDLLGTRLSDVLGDEQTAAVRRVARRMFKGETLIRDEQFSEDASGVMRCISWAHQGVFDDRDRLIEIQSVGRDITQRRLAEEELKRSVEVQRLLLSELNHRVKNTLGGLISLIERQATRSNDVGVFSANLTERIRSVVAIHSLLSSAKWANLDLASVINEVVPPALRDRVSIEGPDISVRADAATPLGMVVQELVSNAQKHGSWTPETGRVDVTWAQNDDGTTTLEWIESDGPPVEAPENFNLGTELIRGFAAFELRGTIEFRFLPEGVHHTLGLRLGEVPVTTPEVIVKTDSTGAVSHSG